MHSPERIKACIDACEGIKTADLEKSKPMLIGAAIVLSQIPDYFGMSWDIAEIFDDPEEMSKFSQN